MEGGVSQNGRLGYTHGNKGGTNPDIQDVRPDARQIPKDSQMEQNANEKHFQPIEPDVDSERLRAMVGRTTDNLRVTDNKPKGTKREKGKITAKQRLFVSLIVQGMSHREAYRKVYGTAQTSESTCASNANRLLSDPKIRSLLDSSLDRDENALLADEALMRRHVMAELLEHSKSMKGESQKLRALELMGKAVGMFTDRVEQTIEQINPETLKDELSKHLTLLDQATKH